MGLADDILKRKTKTPPESNKKVDVGQVALSKSAEANAVYADTEPTIANRTLPRFATDQVVHVDNLNEITPATFPPVFAANGAAIPADSLQVGGEDSTGNLRPIRISILDNQSVQTKDFATSPTGTGVPSQAIAIGVDDGTGLLTIPVEGPNGGIKVEIENNPVINFIPDIPTIASPTLKSAVINFNATGDNTIIAGVLGQTIRIMRMLLTTDGSSTTLTFKDSTPTNFTGAMTLSGLILDDSGEPWYVTASGKGFVINQSGTAQISGTVWYSQS